MMDALETKADTQARPAERRKDMQRTARRAGGARFLLAETATWQAVLGPAPEVRCARRRDATLWKARRQGCPTLEPPHNIELEAVTETES